MQRLGKAEFAFVWQRKNFIHWDYQQNVFFCSVKALGNRKYLQLKNSQNWITF